MTIGSQATLFMGVTPAPGRDYMGRVFTAAREAGYDRVAIPCAGRFSGAIMALRAGYRADQIVASDISLYSALIGELAAGRDPRSLNATIAHLPESPGLAEEFAGADEVYRWAACLLLAQKIATSSAKNPYLAMIHEDLVRGWRRHLDKVEKGLREVVTAMSGIEYRTADMFDEIEAHRGRERTLLHCLPPQYVRGFEKQFDTKGAVTWSAPDAKQFDSKGDHHRLYDLATDPETRALTLFWMIQPNMRDGYAERAVWVLDRKGLYGASNADVIEYLLSNRADEVKAMLGGPIVATAKTVKPVTVQPHPVWGADDDLITPQTRIDFVPVKREVGLYYRDLFAHRLGGTDAEGFVLMLLDGKVFGSVGLFFRQVRLGKRYGWQAPDDDRLFVFETYGLNASSSRYPRLNRLLMMAITCEEFKHVVKSMSRFGLTEPAGLTTACIAQHPEVKINRGILKLVQRERQPDGRYHLVYACPWRPGTYRDQLHAWLSKHGTKGDVDGR
jgi:hypothetical protein